MNCTSSHHLLLQLTPQGLDNGHGGTSREALAQVAIKGWAIERKEDLIPFSPLPPGVGQQCLSHLVMLSRLELEPCAEANLVHGYRMATHDASHGTALETTAYRNQRALSTPAQRATRLRQPSWLHSCPGGIKQLWLA